MLKVLWILSALLITITFSGCCKKEIKYVDKEVIVNVPQKCIVPEPIGCKWKDATLLEKPIRMMECIIELKKNSKVCK